MSHPISKSLAIKLIFGAVSEDDMSFLNNLSPEDKTRVANDFRLTRGFMIEYTNTWEEMFEQFNCYYWTFGESQGKVEDTMGLIEQLGIDNLAC